MSPPDVRVIDGRKYVWDGATYPDEAEAARAAATYREARFEVQLLAAEGAWFVFTRREVVAADAARS